jgi:hypothetical protein
MLSDVERALWFFVDRVGNSREGFEPLLKSVSAAIHHRGSNKFGTGRAARLFGNNKVSALQSTAAKAIRM